MSRQTALFSLFRHSVRGALERPGAWSSLSRRPVGALLWPRAEGTDCTVRTVWFSRMASLASVSDKEMSRSGPLRTRDQRCQLGLNLVRIIRLSQIESLRDPEDVRIHGKGLLTE